MMKIRDLITDDVDAAVNVAQQAFGSHISPSVIEESFKSALAFEGTYCCPVAETDKGLAGYLLLRKVADEAEIISFAVEPQHQGKAFGKKLMEHGLKELAASGIAKIFLEVRVSNVAARKLYESLGGAEIAIREGYYTAEHDGKAEDAVVYRIDL